MSEVETTTAATETVVMDTAIAVRPPVLNAPVGRYPLVPLPEARNQAETPMAGLGEHQFPAEVARILQTAITHEMIDILPTGEAYLPQIQYRRLLNTAFGPGAWGLLPVGKALTQDQTCLQQFALVIHGRTVSVAYGEQKIIHGGMSWATAWESAKSNALMRCCKDLGIASECWDKRAIHAFKAECCVQVEVEVHKGGQDKIEVQWRRQDAPALKGERGVFMPGLRSTAIRRPERTDAVDDFLGSDPPSPAPDMSMAQRRTRDRDDADHLLMATIRRSNDADDLETKLAASVKAREHKATPQDIRKLMAIAKHHGVTEETLRDALGRHGVEHLNEIPTGPCPARCAHKIGGKDCKNLFQQVVKAIETQRLGTKARP